MVQVVSDSGTLEIFRFIINFYPFILGMDLAQSFLQVLALTARSYQPHKTHPRWIDNGGEQCSRKSQMENVGDLLNMELEVGELITPSFKKHHTQSNVSRLHNFHPTLTRNYTNSKRST